MFATPSEGECQAILEKAVPEIQILAQRIQRGENFPGKNCNGGPKSV